MRELAQGYSLNHDPERYILMLVTGKRVRIVSTHEGSELASMLSDVKKMCKGADVDMKGLAIVVSQAKNSKQKVAEWL